MSRCMLLPENYIYGKYQIIEHLGSGEFSNVYKAKDNHNNLFAIKIFRHGSEFRPYFDNEFKILSKIGTSNHPNIIKFTEAFCHLNLDLNNYKSTLHPSLVTELLGDNLLNVFRFVNGGLPIYLVKKFTKQLANALQFIHSNNIIYVDIKAQNVLLDKSIERLDHEEDANVCLIDFNSSTTCDYLFSKSVGTQEYLSPELIVESDYTKYTDIWSLMCLVYEMATGDDLFKTTNKKAYGSNNNMEFSDDNDSYDSDDDDEDNICRKHLMLIEGLLGPIPSEIVRGGRKYRKFFNNRGNLKENPKIEKYNIYNRLISEYNYITENDCKELVEFLIFGLKIDPKQRPTCTQVLAHKWLTNEDGEDTKTSG